MSCDEYDDGEPLDFGREIARPRRETVRPYSELIEQFAVEIAFRGRDAVVRMDESLKDVMGDDHYDGFRRAVMKMAYLEGERWRLEEERLAREKEEKKAREKKEFEEKRRSDIEKIRSDMTPLARDVVRAAFFAKLRDVVFSQRRSGVDIASTDITVRFEIPGVHGIGDVTVATGTRLSANHDFVHNVIDSIMRAWVNASPLNRHGQSPDLNGEFRTILGKHAARMRKSLRSSGFIKKADDAIRLEAQQVLRREMRTVALDMMRWKTAEEVTGEVADILNEEVARQVMAS